MTPSRVLIVEDQAPVAKALALLLELHGATVRVATSPPAALAVAAEWRPELVLQDMNFRPGATSGEEGVALFGQLRSLDPDLPVLLLTAWGAVETAVRLMRAGAADYLEKPWDDAKLIARVGELLAGRGGQPSLEQQEPGRRQDLGDLVYASPVMHQLVTLALRVARSDVPLLITGPNGTGKEMLADLVHRSSPRRDRPFVKVNVGALPDTLLEAELFGAEAGAFTGAGKRREGRFEAADGGTLLLDEIGTLSPGGQAKLLRVLQSGEVERLGSSRSIRTNVRVIAATNADLPAAIQRGEFREDLYFRLNVVELAVPALAVRREDVLPLAEHFLRTLGPPGGGLLTLSDESRRRLTAHGWPGNVRELRNRIQRAALVASGRVIVPADLDLERGATATVAVPAPPARGGDEEAERLRIEGALRAADGVVLHAAERLGMSRQALYRRMERHGLVVERRPRSVDPEAS